MIDYFQQNKEWIFSGAGIAIIALVFRLFGRGRPNGSASVVNENVVINNSVWSTVPKLIDDRMPPSDTKPSDELKLRARILFIDDDEDFKIVSILKRSGWRNVDIVKDVRRLDQEKLKSADIVFLDIHGVGKSLGFTKEGWGLLAAIKDKYPGKKVIVYSSSSNHDIFSKEAELADAKLRKSAEFYDFESTIERHLGL